MITYFVNYSTWHVEYTEAESVADLLQEGEYGFRYADELNDLSTTQLVALYNAHADKPVNKFSTRAKAVERVWRLISGLTLEQRFAEETAEEEQERQQAEADGEESPKAKGQAFYKQVLAYLADGNVLCVKAYAAQTGHTEKQVRGAVDRIRANGVTYIFAGRGCIRLP